MISNNLQAIVLAAGQSKRFKTQTSKLVEKLCGKEMILYVLSALQKLGIDTTVVVGHQKELVEKTISAHHSDGVKFITQETQEGTGHAVASTQSTWHKDLILVVNGDMPLITSDLIELLYKKHLESNATVSLVVAYDVDPVGAYGRIVQTGDTLSIVEAKEFTYNIQDYPYINAGIYLFDRTFLESAISTLQRSSITNELYITDLIKIASDHNKKINPVTVELDLVRGINTVEELAAAEQILRAQATAKDIQKGKSVPS